MINQLLGIGDWGLGIGDWGVGSGPNHQSPIPNPQSPIPNPQSPIYHNEIISKKNFYKFQMFYINKIKK